VLVNVFDNDVESWEQLARTDPLWAVLSADEFHGAALTPEAEERFWRSGEEHVAHVTSIIRAELDPSFEPKVALDFGCGVGRNLVPLAERCRSAIGLDVSATMAERCRTRLAECGLDNADALVIERRIDPAEFARFGPVDFVHSVLVFQHVVTHEGFGLFDQLLELLVPGGHGFVHFHCKSPGGALARSVKDLRLRHPRFNALALNSRIPQLRDVVMLYEYDVLDLLDHLARHAMHDVVLERIDTGQGGYDARLYFAKFSGTEEEFALAGRPMKVRVRP
jgi:SAM-dependent methyltransferase